MTNLIVYNQVVSCFKQQNKIRLQGDLEEAQLQERAKNNESLGEQIVLRLPVVPLLNTQMLCMSEDKQPS